MRLSLRDLAERIVEADFGTMRLLTCLVDVRREILSQRIASYRSGGKESVARIVECEGDALATGVEGVLREHLAQDAPVTGNSEAHARANVGIVVELSYRELAERIQGLNYGTQRFLSHLVDARRERAEVPGADRFADGIEALLREGLY